MKKFIAQFLALITVMSLVLAAGAIAVYALKLVVVSDVLIAIFMTAAAYTLFTSLVLNVQANNFQATLLNKTIEEQSTEFFDIDNFDVSTLTIRTDDLNLREYALRARFIENRSYDDGITALIDYLKARVEESIQYEKLPLPVVSKILTRVDENLPESTLAIIHQTNSSVDDNEDFEDDSLFDDFPDTKIN